MATLSRLLASSALALAVASCGGGGGGGSDGSQTGGNGNPPPQSALSGRVATADGTPVAGALVTAFQTNEHLLFTTTTGADGRYAFEGLDSDTYADFDVYAVKDGWGFAPAPMGRGAVVRRADEWGLYRTVLGFTPGGSGTTNTQGDFRALDGSHGVITLPAQATLGGARFTDNADGSVTDRLTGLVWLKDAGCLGSTDWASAVAAARTLAAGRCGLADGSSAGQWRLPNVVELESLVDATQAAPALPAGHPFARVGTNMWTSTTYRGNESAAWVIRLTDGRWMNDGAVNAKTATGPAAWAVRDGAVPGAVALPSSGQQRTYAAGDDAALAKGVPLPWPRFIDKGNGTLVGTLTGLTWLKQANCLRADWAGAQDAVARLASGQCGLADGSAAGDWRMPSRAEMLSLADRALGNHADDFATTFRRSDGTLERAAIFETLVSSEFYWTRSPDAADAAMAWTLYSCDFGVYDIAKSATGYTLAVR